MRSTQPSGGLPSGSIVVYGVVCIVVVLVWAALLQVVDSATPTESRQTTTERTSLRTLNLARSRSALATSSIYPHSQSVMTLTATVPLLSKPGTRQLVSESASGGNTDSTALAPSVEDSLTATPEPQEFMPTHWAMIGQTSATVTPTPEPPERILIDAGPAAHYDPNFEDGYGCDWTCIYYTHIERYGAIQHGPPSSDSSWCVHAHISTIGATLILESGGSEFRCTIGDTVRTEHVAAWYATWGIEVSWSLFTRLPDPSWVKVWQEVGP